MKNNFTLVADMGATYSRLALLDENFNFSSTIEVLPSKEFSSPAQLISYFIKQQQIATPKTIHAAIAAPINGDGVSCSNVNWHFSIKDTNRYLETSIEFINDFEALSLSLDSLKFSDIIELGKTEASLETNLPRVLIGTGSGFGTASVIRHNEQIISIPSEGGHSLYAPQDLEEIEIMRIASQEKIPLTIEDFLSGDHGLDRLARAMGILYRQPVTFSSPKELIEKAKQKNPLAIAVIERYCIMLGNVAANIALITGAQGGVYIGGGFAPRITSYLIDSKFRQSFENITSVHSYLEKIPTFVITHPFATLIGLQYRLISAT